MRIAARSVLAASLAVAIVWPVFAQQTQPAASEPPGSTRRPAAATVNGEPIAEVAVQRGLKRVPADKHAEARGEILEFLIDNALIDQSLQKQSIAVEKKEIDGMID